MPVLTEKARAGEAIMSEGLGNISRDNVIVAASQSIAANALVAKVAVAASVSVTQTFVGAGNGVLTIADPAVSSRVKDGVYTAVCIEPASNAGTFEVRDPAGKVIGTATVGVAFNKEVKFTIADGSTDFVAGDTFSLTVAADAGDYQFVDYDPVGTDGSEIPAAYSPYEVTTASDATKAAVVLSRMCELNGNCIAWPSGITDAQKADAIQALAANNIIVRY